MNKVYEGLNSIQDHIKELDMKGWVPHTERKMLLTEAQAEQFEVIPDYIEITKCIPKQFTEKFEAHDERVYEIANKQSFEIQRLKRDSGLTVK